MLKIVTSSNRRAVNRIVERRDARDPLLARRVRTILRRVREGGDRALIAYAQRFDGLQQAIELTPEEIAHGARRTTPELRAAIRVAARNIRRVARHQVPRAWRVAVDRGVWVEQRVRPLDRVGCYVPGGRHPLPSSLLMTAIPAGIAGVPEIIVVCPRPDPAVLAAALEARVSRVFRIGGAHAVAALAYGTSSVPAVDKIVGPGNAYVAEAKAQVSTECPIDLHAGPSEIVVISRTGRPEWIAADLMAQAEHDPDARAIFLTPSLRLAQRVARQVAKSLDDATTRSSLRRNGGVIVTRTLDEAVAIANRIAPEHLVCDEPAVARTVTRAGAIFLGPYTAQAAGDYATGSNHVLPTNGAARFRGGLSAADFVKLSAVQRLSRRGLTSLAPTILALARAEGLEHHARSVEVRLS